MQKNDKTLRASNSLSLLILTEPRHQLHNHVTRMRKRNQLSILLDVTLNWCSNLIKSLFYFKKLFIWKVDGKLCGRREQLLSVIQFVYLFWITFQTSDSFQTSLSIEPECKKECKICIEPVNALNNPPLLFFFNF